MNVPISDQEFAQFQRFIYTAAGISLPQGKKALVAGRLAGRLRDCQVASYGAYLQLLQSGAAQAEVQRAIDLLTTNETYFFREPQHFELLAELAQAASQHTAFRVWSAASSTGEEAYSIAMVLADRMQTRPWEVVASDISARVLAKAKRGHYDAARAENIPSGYLKRYCLRGVGPQQGTLLITRELRQKVQFVSLNLNEALPKLGQFDVIFLRNVLIYFDAPTKRQVVERISARLKPHGHLMIGHCESLNGITQVVTAVAPATYRLPASGAAR